MFVYCRLLFSDPKSKGEEKKVESKPWRANMLKPSSTESPNPVEPEKAKPVEPEKAKEEKEIDEEEQRPWRKNMKKAEDHVKGKSNFVHRHLVISETGDLQTVFIQRPSVKRVMNLSYSVKDY